MSDASKDLKVTLQKELDHLAEVRDELRVQLALAKAEAKEEWNRLEGSWDKIQDDIKKIGEQTKEPVQQIGHAANELVQELKRGYERLRTQFKA
jgi:predicted  nucleic acid-binding Zn-ribbon protein